ncbi:arylalkylamine N-acetyltransferase 1-like [Metopolophium dirhodum]|uniref:arylalkylamine N-acetyltransferase 1-like n=1 Tax=Metopolophium dirhodum TaxID=44670 RepID=UPI00298FFE43|nr:arylalkylamine N-acetyltransferase 1-like [Metopolophium dirhodum]
MDENKKLKMQFNIVPIIDNDSQSVLSFIEKYFIRDEPLKASVALIKEKESIVKFKDFCCNIFNNGDNILYVMGVTLNTIMSKDDLIVQYGDENFISNLKFDDIEVFLYKIRRDIDLYEKYPNVDRIMELKIISVNEKYRGQGVCKALINKLKELALKLEYKMMYAECSSCFTAKAMERAGFQCIYSLSYSDYVNKQGKQVFNMAQPPHECIKVQVLEL